MSEMMLIAFRPIPKSTLEPSLLYREKEEDTVSMTFYIDNMFVTLASFKKQFKFLTNYFFPLLARAQLW
jgi:hypothetical protein